MNEIKKLQAAILHFRDERDWAKFHNPKDLAINLSVEAAELLELFLWKNSDEANPENVKRELADVLYSSLLLASTYGFDVERIVLEKLKENAKRYPVEKAHGRKEKYDEL